jgi:phage baseplate assembly protein W
MASAIKTPVFKDFDLNMKMHPTTGKLIIRKNDESLKQALKCLLLTDKGERPFRPFLGCDIRQNLFELIHPALDGLINFDIRNAVETYDERIEILSVSSSADPDNNSLQVNVVFRPINGQTPINLNFTLEALR